MSIPANSQQAEKIRAAQSITAAGFAIIPLNGKIPAVQDWTKTAPGTFKPEALGAQNYGVVLPPSCLVIDVDPRHFQQGDKPLERLMVDIGAPAFKTFVVQTGGGGLHIYLTKPEDIEVRNELPKYPGIEFKSSGRQVVGPGSVHPDTGKVYAIAHGAPGSLLTAPEALLALIEKKAVAPAANGLAAPAADDQARARFAEYLEKTAPLAYEGQNGDQTTFRVACVGRDYGLSMEDTGALMATKWNDRCGPPWSPRDLEAKVANAYRYASSAAGNKHPSADFPVVDGAKPPAAAGAAGQDAKKDDGMRWDLGKGNVILKTYNNLSNYLRMPDSGLIGLFGYNEFTQQIEVTRPAPWHRGKMPAFAGIIDADLKMLKAYLVKKYQFEVPIGLIDEAINEAAYHNRFHPVREYLEGLKWDGVPRLDSWLTTYAAVKPSKYVSAVGRKTLCAAVLRVFKPGCQFDHVLVLEGRQKLGKTSLCRILGGAWFGDPVIDPHNKDTIAALQGKWIVELAEMEVNTRAETSSLKAFITRLSDKARLAYGRLSMEFPRQCIFIGTINPGPDGTYLKDNTGNRRFWPVEMTDRLDFRGLKAVRDQLWAEAVAAVRAGEKIYLDTAELEDEAEAVAGARHAEHPWTERIQDWLNTPAAVGLDGKTEKRTFVTSREVFVEAMGGLDKQLDRRAMLSIAEVMKILGWARSVSRAGDKVIKGYRAPASAEWM